MSSSPFSRLAPFIQQYIYQNQWSELRDIQVQAIAQILDTPHHLLLAAGTASGKTEAVFLPILSDLYENPAASVGVLYIGPTKALINDQFYRLEGLLKESDLPVWAWHGDVGVNQKQKLLKKPTGILQITPESLESLLINHINQLPTLFGELRYVILDEVHVFMNSDRGRQVLCQLTRLERYCSKPPRRIGLSATLGDYEEAKSWLKAQTLPEIVLITGQKKQNLRLAVEQFFQGKNSEPNNEPELFVQYIFDRTQERTKSLIFANNRQDVESIIASLRQLAQYKKLPDIYHVHHGSISASLRETTELAMKKEHQPAVTAATITLELGIDIGQLERVIQIDAPFSVSSFLQRLGRSGRRGNPSEMWFACRSNALTGQEKLGQRFPWSLLQSIAIIQLYLEERWLEPLEPIAYPFSLLYHQTMSFLAGAGSAAPALLAQRVLTLPPFSAISLDDYRELLRHLLDIDHLEKMPTGELIIGLTGEKIVRNYRFYAVFQENEEFAVRASEGEIGRITMLPPVGERFMLAGRTWEVLDINTQQKIIFVKKVPGKSNSSWLGGGGNIHLRVIQKMKQVLTENVIYKYLQPTAQTALASARQLATEIELENHFCIPLSDDSFCLFPWLGTKEFALLSHYLQQGLLPQVQLIQTDAPYYLEIRSNLSPLILEENLRQVSWATIDKTALLPENSVPEIHKFDAFIPSKLRYKAYLSDNLRLPSFSDF